MKRDIRFRAWDKEQNIMLYDFDQNTPGVKLGQSIHLKVYETGLLYNTFMQYTGLKDRIGKEIYEGDIIEFTPTYEPKDRRRVPVYWQEFRAGFACEWNKLANEDLFKSVQYGNEAEVVGNIYENPELLQP